MLQYQYQHTDCMSSDNKQYLYNYMIGASYSLIYKTTTDLGIGLNDVISYSGKRPRPNNDQSTLFEVSSNNNASSEEGTYNVDNNTGDATPAARSKVDTEITAIETQQEESKPLYIFFAGNNGNGYTGDFVSQARQLGYNPLNSIEAADNICYHEIQDTEWHPNLPKNYYKAMISDREHRIACTTPNCISGGSNENHDWVFLPLTTYDNEARVNTLSTNEAAIPSVKFSMFTRGSTSISANGSYGRIWRTGLNASYQSDTRNCSEWTTPSAQNVSTSGGVDLNIVGRTINRSASINNIQYGGTATNYNQTLVCLFDNQNNAFGGRKNTYGIMCVEQKPAHTLLK